MVLPGSKQCHNMASAVVVKGSAHTRAISLFRKIMRAAHRWEAPDEREYIRKEAYTLFRQNSGLTDAEQIEAKLHEATTRLELGLYYGIPYPRPTYTFPGATGQETEGVQPDYMHSKRSMREPQGALPSPLKQKLPKIRTMSCALKRPPSMDCTGQRHCVQSVLISFL
ncbi:LYR motif-containing protein 1 [Porphyridium purpureum]|uniref:LYR motif-containing protein 1 n=1 Tax=Porphyridium purpureum TaxID=35688 RepID=A0A5J4YT83_PORPP|nr:LYR motif-containing protein 1 [Porphyridium purpureum]|eukprot:POR6439..scf229_5